MQYRKPEVASLGQAAELILGEKVIIGFETSAPFTRRGVPDSELDD